MLHAARPPDAAPAQPAALATARAAVPGHLLHRGDDGEPRGRQGGVRGAQRPAGRDRLGGQADQAANARSAGWAGWIAGQDVDGTGVWTWDYGHTWDYDYWGPDNPENPATERCVLLTTNNKWYSRDRADQRAVGRLLHTRAVAAAAATAVAAPAQPAAGPRPAHRRPARRRSRRVATPTRPARRRRRCRQPGCSPEAAAAYPLSAADCMAHYIRDNIIGISTGVVSPDGVTSGICYFHRAERKHYFRSVERRSGAPSLRATAWRRRRAAPPSPPPRRPRRPARTAAPTAEPTLAAARAALPKRRRLPSPPRPPSPSQPAVAAAARCRRRRPRRRPRRARRRCPSRRRRPRRRRPRRRATTTRLSTCSISSSAPTARPTSTRCRSASSTSSPPPR